MRTKGLIMHDKEDLVVFVPQYPTLFSSSLTRKRNAWFKVGELNNQVLVATKCNELRNVR